MVEFITTDSNEALDLPSDAVLTVTVNNPIFDTENADRIYSYPMRLKWTDKNKVALNFGNRVDSPVNINPIGLIMKINGNTFEKGIGVIDEDSFSEFQMNFQNNTRAILTELEALDISTILDTVLIPQNVIIPHWYFNVKNYNSTLFALTINNVQYSVSNTPGTGFDKSVHLTYLANQINAVYPGLAFYDSASNRLKLSDPDYKYKITVGYVNSLESSDFANYNQAQAANFYHYLASEFDNPSVSHRFPLIRNEDFYPTQKRPESYQGYINFQKKQGANLIQGENEAYTAPDFRYTFVPYVRVRYVLNKIAAALNILPIQFEFENSAEFENLLIVNNQCLDSLIEDTYTDFNTGISQKKTLNAFRKKIDLNEHVPSMTAKDFLIALAGVNLYFVVEDGTIIFRKKNESVKLPITDMTDKIDIDLTRKRKKSEGFTIDYKRDKSESVSISGQLQKYVEGLGKNPIEIPFYTLPDTIYEGTKLPLSTQQGSTDYEGIGKKTFQLALIFDRGLQIDSAGRQYYQASSGVTNFMGETIGYYSLDINGDVGLFHQFFDGIVELMDGNIYISMMRLSAHELATLRQWRTIGKIYLSTETGSILCVIKNIQFKASTRSVGEVVCKVEFVAYP